MPAPGMYGTRGSEYGNLVYVLRDPRDNAIRYVGKTIGYVNARVTTHLWEARETKKRTHKLSWLRQLLTLDLAPVVEVVERCETADELSDVERRWIARLRAEGARLTNMTDGGEGMVNPPESTRAKLRARTPSTPSESARRASSERLKRLWADPEYRARQMARIHEQAAKRRGTGANPRNQRRRLIRELGPVGYAQWKREHTLKMVKTRTGCPAIEHRLTHDGRTLTPTEWAAELGISRSTIYGRIERGWAVEDVLDPRNRKHSPARSRV